MRPTAIHCQDRESAIRVRAAIQGAWWRACCHGRWWAVRVLTAEWWRALRVELSARWLYARGRRLGQEG